MTDNELRIPLFPKRIRKIESQLEGWSGWRLAYWCLFRNDPCDECGARWSIGVIDTPLFLPRDVRDGSRYRRD